MASRVFDSQERDGWAAVLLYLLTFVLFWVLFATGLIARAYIGWMGWALERVEGAPGEGIF